MPIRAHLDLQGVVQDPVAHSFCYGWLVWICCPVHLLKEETTASTAELFWLQLGFSPLVDFMPQLDVLQLGFGLLE